MQILSILMAITLAILIGCNQAKSEPPQVRPKFPDFEWNLSDKEWDTKETYTNELLYTLKHIDHEIHKIKRARWSIGNSRYNSKEYAQYLQLRLNTLKLLKEYTHEDTHTKAIRPPQ